MSSKAMSLKAKIRNYAKNKKIASQVVLQNYMFERFLARLAISEFKDRFIIKGGMLIAAIVGLNTRSTMDLDATLKGLPLNEVKVLEIIRAIIKIDLGDDVSFDNISIDSIRKDDPYGGFCVRINAVYDTIITPLSIDLSTGDTITPEAVIYRLSGLFDEDLYFNLWGYNIETILAEKVETILSRGVLNTRPRDYYDVYILTTSQAYDKLLFKNALNATAEHRNSLRLISDYDVIIDRISKSQELYNMWKKYQQRFPYAAKIEYKDIIRSLQNLLL